MELKKPLTDDTTKNTSSADLQPNPESEKVLISRRTLALSLNALKGGPWEMVNDSINEISEALKK